MKNVHEIFTMDIEPYLKRDKLNPFTMKETGEQLNPSHLFGMLLEVCNVTYDLPVIKDILQQKFNLVFMLPFFNERVFGLAHHLNIPTVMFVPAAIPNMYVSKIGGHFPPSFIPNWLLGYKPEMTFEERFINYGKDQAIELYMNWAYLPKVENTYREKLGQNIPGVNQILGNTSLFLSNSHFSLTGPRPYFPDVVDVGGLHSQPAKPVPKELADFIEKGNDGFIYFSLGTAIKNDMMSDEKRQIFLNVFSRLKQQVLWKWESETMPNRPDNVKLSKWLPQQDLLGRKDIRMFITHCGGGSTEESIYHGIPMFGDQVQNAKLAKEKGFLVELDWNELTEEKLELTINEILDNPLYRDNVQKLSALFKDRPMKPSDVAAYWIEYVLRHQGALQLRSAGRNMNAFVYHSVDVLLAYLVIILMILYLLYAILRCVLQKAFLSIFGRKDKLSTNKKTK